MGKFFDTRRRVVNRFTGLWIALALFLSISSISEANWYYRPYHQNVYVGGAALGWGLFGWPGVMTVNGPVWGNSYWDYYNYEPRYATFGAIAVSKTTKHIGYSFNHQTRTDAEKDAVNYCGEEDCKTVVWVQGGCGALAYSESTGQMGYAYNALPDYVRGYAVRGCKRSRATDCKPVAWVCSY